MVVTRGEENRAKSFRYAGRIMYSEVTVMNNTVLSKFARRVDLPFFF